MAAAISLAAKGHAVQLYEQGERLGGKLNIRSGKGYTFDTGPSILTMPWVLEQLFARADRNLSDFLTVKRVEPQWRTFFPDGTRLDVSGDLSAMLEQVQQSQQIQASDFLDYLHYCCRMYELSTKSFYQHSLSGLKDLRKRHTWRELLEMAPRRTMAQKTAAAVKDPHWQQVINFLAMYIGSSPYNAPAILSQLVFVQLGLGVHYVEGGMAKIAEAMGRLLQELDVEVHTDTTVTAIRYEDSRATGISLDKGADVDASVIVCNREVIPTYRSLLSHHPQAEQAIQRLRSYPPTVSGLVLLLGINRTYDHLAHHNFFFSADPKQEFKQLFTDGKPADDPTVYVGISSKTDPSQAPKGKENWFVLTHVPPLKPGESWEPYRQPYREKVLNKLEQMGIDNIRDHIEWETQFIPDDLYQLYGANGGSIYGVVTDRKMNGGFKIPSRSSLLKNLYFVGGSTHPGGGVPMVTLSGQLTADLILHDGFQPEKEETTDNE